MYVCTHLSNTASVLLPVSNLTNLLAFTASGLSFTRFAALIALPRLAAIGVECGVFRRFFATDLDAGAQAPPVADPPELPLFALVTVGCTLAGFVLTSVLGINPAWAALAGAPALAVRALLQRRTTPKVLLRGSRRRRCRGPGARPRRGRALEPDSRGRLALDAEPGEQGTGVGGGDEPVLHVVAYAGRAPHAEQRGEPLGLLRAVAGPRPAC